MATELHELLITDYDIVAIAHDFNDVVVRDQEFAQLDGHRWMILGEHHT